METLYKLTRQNYTTCGNTLWGENVERTAKGGQLCTADVIHAYRHPLLAVFFNPIHAGFEKPILWEAEGEVCVEDGTKVGCTRLKTLRIIEVPSLSTEQRVEIAIRCALVVCKEESFVVWANNWLNGKDRSWAAAEVQRSVWAAAAWAVESAAAAWAESAAEEAARTAAWAVESAVEAAARTAPWAARAARAAAEAGNMPINILEIILKVAKKPQEN